MYTCTHVLLSVETDLCEVACAAGPAHQFAFQCAVWCLCHIVTDAFSVTNGSDDGVLISVT